MSMLLVLAALHASAQSPPAPPPPAGPATSGPEVGPPEGAQTPEAAAAQRALSLPMAARDLRRAGVPETDVQAMLDAARSAGLAAADTTEIVAGAARMAREHGPVENFGAFVQGQLNAGLRGTDLAAAIAAEHAAHGAMEKEKQGKVVARPDGPRVGQPDVGPDVRRGNPGGVVAEEPPSANGRTGIRGGPAARGGADGTAPSAGGAKDKGKGKDKGKN